MSKYSILETNHNSIRCLCMIEESTCNRRSATVALCDIGTEMWVFPPVIFHQMASNVFLALKKVSPCQIIFIIMKFILSCHCLFIYVCLRTLMVTCDYEVSLVFISFYSQLFLAGRKKEGEKGKEMDLGEKKTEVMTWEFGWDERDIRSESTFALQMHFCHSPHLLYTAGE